MKFSTIVTATALASTSLASHPEKKPNFHLQVESKDDESINGKFVNMSPMADAAFMRASLNDNEPKNGVFTMNGTVLAYIWNTNKDLIQAATIQKGDDHMNKFVVQPKLVGQNKFDDSFSVKDEYIKYNSTSDWYACDEDGNGVRELRWYEGGHGVSYPCKQVELKQKFV